ncbi:hypothetical protein TNCT_418761 [Trichonephila clavata]|uniref:Uncharacterized protein n=1 Tax=Trichonephila clavata TaxID=2740835 RepID=A0A8X6HUW3_TRICU|nr:hypothetical protein TNCT_418761 [Trichonephila clavata]
MSGPSRVHQNTVYPELCSESFNISVNFLFGTSVSQIPTTTGRRGHRRTIPRPSERKEGECHVSLEQPLCLHHSVKTVWTGHRWTVSCVNQNARTVGPEHCSEFVHSTMNVVPLRNECDADPSP